MTEKAKKNTVGGALAPVVDHLEAGGEIRRDMSAGEGEERVESAYVAYKTRYGKYIVEGAGSATGAAGAGSLMELLSIMVQYGELETWELVEEG